MIPQSIQEHVQKAQESVSASLASKERIVIAVPKATMIRPFAKNANAWLMELLGKSVWFVLLPVLKKNFQPTDGQCPCKEGYGGVFCETCSPGFTNVTAGCIGCNCNDIGAENKNCSAETGQCVCKSAYSGLACDQCQLGYFGFPECTCSFFFFLHS